VAADGLRSLFDLPREVAYLNCAYMSPLARPVIEAGERGVRRKARPWEIHEEDFFADVETLRARFAAIAGADADGVAIVAAASYGVAVAARNLPLGRGQRVVVLAEQFPSNVYAWRELARAGGGELVTVERPAAGSWTKAVLGAIDEQAAIVAVPAAHWTDGSTVDLERVGEAARSSGAALVVDATQSLGAVPFDAARVRPDFLIAAAYKWLLGPYGLGFLWVAPERREGVPLEHNWIARAGSERFARLVDYRDEFQSGARRYDVGERSSFALVPMAVAALEILLGAGVEAIAHGLAAHTARIADGARALGLSAPDDDARGPHMVGLRLPEGGRPDLAARLAERGVHVSQRGSALRVSPHVYNDAEDVERLLEALGPLV
jgi:selenocysteine lyase/cysteine desulfurase